MSVLIMALAYFSVLISPLYFSYCLTCSFINISISPLALLLFCLAMYSNFAFNSSFVLTAMTGFFAWHDDPSV